MRVVNAVKVPVTVIVGLKFTTPLTATFLVVAPELTSVILPLELPVAVLASRA